MFSLGRYYYSSQSNLIMPFHFISVLHSRSLLCDSLQGTLLQCLLSYRAVKQIWQNFGCHGTVRPRSAMMRVVKIFFISGSSIIFKSPAFWFCLENLTNATLIHWDRSAGFWKTFSAVTGRFQLMDVLFAPYLCDNSFTSHRLQYDARYGKVAKRTACQGANGKESIVSFRKHLANFIFKKCQIRVRELSHFS